MKTKIVISFALLLVASLACGLVSSATTISTQSPETSTSKVAECDPANWRLAITSLSQVDEEGDKKIIIATVGVENNDPLWGYVSGPLEITGDANPKVFLTAKDGSTFGKMQVQLPRDLSTKNNSVYAPTGQVETAVMAPGLVSIGNAFMGKPYLYNFAFEIPATQIPVSITVSGMQASCILAPTKSDNGQSFYVGQNISLPSKRFNIGSDIGDINKEPRSNKFPDLIGSKLDMPNQEGVIEFTNAERKGNQLIISFSYTNLTSVESSPEFNGYVIGDSRVFSCQSPGEFDCKNQSLYVPVQAGQTAQGLTWSFTLPENDTNLMLVYVYGDVVNINKVYSINTK